MSGPFGRRGHSLFGSLVYYSHMMTFDRSCAENPGRSLTGRRLPFLKAYQGTGTRHLCRRWMSKLRRRMGQRECQRRLGEVVTG